MLTHVHPVVPLIVWAPVVLFLVWRSYAVLGISALSIVLVGVGAMIFWTLAEYFLHRFVFHFRAESPAEKRLQFLIHGLHHDDPVDPTRLVMPPAAAVILAIILFSLFRLALGPVWVEPFFAFFLVGYLCYDYTHYWIHHFTPRSKFGKMIKQHHMLHHFTAHNAKWGVSSPLWDYIFRTMEEKPR